MANRMNPAAPAAWRVMTCSKESQSFRSPAGACLHNEMANRSNGHRKPYYGRRTDEEPQAKSKHFSDFKHRVKRLASVAWIPEIRKEARYGRGER